MFSSSQPRWVVVAEKTSEMILYRGNIEMGGERSNSDLSKLRCGVVLTSAVASVATLGASVVAGPAVSVGNLSLISDKIN